jgi:hypothetical protein
MHDEAPDHFTQNTTISGHSLPRLMDKTKQTSFVTSAIAQFYICLLLLVKTHRLRVFENRVLRRIFGPKKDEVTGQQKK